MKDPSINPEEAPIVEVPYNNPEQPVGLTEDPQISSKKPLRLKIATFAAIASGVFTGGAEVDTNQVEARTPVNTNEPRMAMIGTVTVKETYGRKDGGLDTTVKVSRERYDPFPQDDLIPTELYTALNGSTKPITTTYKANKYNPLKVQFKLPDAYGCGIPKQAKFPVHYNSNRRLHIKGRPKFKKLFGKRSFTTNFRLSTATSTGDNQKDMEIIGQDPYNIPFEKTQKLKTLKNRPNKTSTAKTMINLETCYPISGTVDPKYDKHKAAGYENIPYSIVAEYNSIIKNGKKGSKYAAVEVEGKLRLVDVQAYNPDAYASAK